MRTQLKSGKVIIFYFLEAFFIFKSEKIEKLEKSQNLLKLLTVHAGLEEVEGCSAKTTISATSPKIAKNWSNRRIC